MGSSLMLQIVNGKGKKWKREENKKKEKSLPPIYRSFAGMACQNIPRKASGKMTQAALDLSGTVVLAGTHSKLESIFLLCGCVRGGNGQGQDRKWQESNG